MELGTVLGFALAVIVLNLVPGPGMMFILAHGISGGRRSGVVAASGMATGATVHTALAAFGLSALLRAAPGALDAIRLIGACFLLYLAVKTYWSTRHAVALAPEGNGPSIRRTYVSAVLTNLANPKVILFYLAFLPQFLIHGGWPVAAQILTLGSVYVVIGIVMDCSVGLAAGTFSALLQSRPAVQRSLKRLSAAIFGGLAVRLLAARP
jgi:threonine/homoserine/homoserine lactone efflux protein